MLYQIGNSTRGSIPQDASARQMYEVVRSNGLNYESDLAQALVLKKSELSSTELNQQQQNLKAALLKLTQGEAEQVNSKAAQHAEQALSNLTGQQLLSKSDSSGTLQNMFLNLTMLLGGEPENIQVFLNSHKKGQQIDWENCSIYFLLETKRLGDVGVLLSSTERNLSITIKNDKPGFKEKMEPLAASIKEKLQGIGYNLGSVQFSRISTAVTSPVGDSSNNDQKPLKPVFTEKGMDFKI
jgi:hypothetical protein